MISLQHFTWADYSIIAIVIISALISLMRGFIREAISLATWIVAAWVAIRFSPLFADSLSKWIHNPSFRTAAAFIILFFIVLILGALINHLFGQLIDKTGLSGTDRLLGLIFGAARGLLFVGVLVLLGNISNMTKDSWWNDSQLIPQFQGLAHWLQSFVPAQIDDFTQDFMNQDQNQSQSQGQNQS